MKLHLFMNIELTYTEWGKEFEQENSFYSGKNGKKKIESGNK